MLDTDTTQVWGVLQKVQNQETTHHNLVPTIPKKIGTYTLED